MPQFAATIRHLEDGLKGFTVSAAVKNIEGWEATLKDLDTPGAKGIVRDLEALKKHLHEKEIDGTAVKKLLAKLGKESVAMAAKADHAKAEKVKALGEALEAAAETDAEADPKN